MKSAVFMFNALLCMVTAQSEWYYLKTKADIDTLSNLYLSSKNGKIAAYAGSRESANVAQKFFTSSYPSSSTVSFHAGSQEQQVSLSGKNGLLNLVDLRNPSAETIPADTPTEWSVFIIGRGGEIRVRDGREVEGKWVVYLETDGNYYVGYWDGATRQPRTIANATLIAERATAPV